MKKTLLILLVCLFLMGTLVACGNERTTTSPTEDENVLTAVILHIDDVDVLVEITENDDIWHIPQRIGFHRAELNDIGAVVGDTVVITYTDFETETYPAWIEATDWALPETIAPEEMTDANITATDWIDLGVIRIPSTWSFSEVEDVEYAPPAISLFGEGANGEIYMDVWAVPFGCPSMLIDGFSSQQVFNFDDGRNGYMLEGRLFESDTLVIWYLPDEFVALSLHYDGDDSVFTDNADLILSIARTLTSATWFD